MKRKGFYSILLFLFAAFAHESQAQVRVQASLDKDKILIGEQMQLSIEAYVPLGQPVIWQRLDTIPHFEILAKQRIDTTQSIEGNKYSQSVTITSFDSGRWVIPQLEFVVAGQAYYTDTIPVEVVFTAFDPSEDYHDIKGIEEVRHPYAGYIPYLILAGAVISIGAVAYLLTLRRKVVEVKPIPPPPAAPRISPFDIAMKKLAKLKEERLDENGQVKEFYTTLNDVLKDFLHARLNIKTLEKTNTEIAVQLRDRKLPPETYQKLIQALQVSDFVKFAKYQPEKQANDENFNVIESAIKLLNSTY